jgi:rod shape-determining protein MreD
VGVLFLVLIAVVAAALPDACPTFWGISSAPPDLFVAVAALLALRGSGPRAVPWAIALGFAKDAVSLDPLGTHAFVLGTTALLLGRERVMSQAPEGAGRAVAVAGAALLAHAIYVLRMIPVSRSGPTLSGLLVGFPVALWTGLLTWPILSLLERTRALDDLVGRSRGLPA